MNILLDSKKIFDKKPEEYPSSISTDADVPKVQKKVADIIKKAKLLHYPFVTLAITHHDDKSFGFCEGAYFLKLALKSSSNNKTLRWNKKEISDFDFYALELSENSEKSFKPFLNKWIKNALSSFRVPQSDSKLKLSVLLDSINPYISEEAWDQSRYIKVLNKLCTLLNSKKFVDILKNHIQMMNNLNSSTDKETSALQLSL